MWSLDNMVEEFECIGVKMFKKIQREDGSGMKERGMKDSTAFI